MRVELAPLGSQGLGGKILTMLGEGELLIMDALLGFLLRLKPDPQIIVLSGLLGGKHDPLHVAMPHPVRSAKWARARVWCRTLT